MREERLVFLYCCVGRDGNSFGQSHIPESVFVSSQPVCPFPKPFLLPSSEISPNAVLRGEGFIGGRKPLKRKLSVSAEGHFLRTWKTKDRIPPQVPQLYQVSDNATRMHRPQKLPLLLGISGASLLAGMFRVYLMVIQIHELHVLSSQSPWCCNRTDMLWIPQNRLTCCTSLPGWLALKPSSLAHDYCNTVCTSNHTYKMHMCAEQHLQQWRIQTWLHRDTVPLRTNLMSSSKWLIHLITNISRISNSRILL